MYLSTYLSTYLPIYLPIHLPNLQPSLVLTKDKIFEDPIREENSEAIFFKIVSRKLGQEVLRTGKVSDEVIALKEKI